MGRIPKKRVIINLGDPQNIHSFSKNGPQNEFFTKSGPQNDMHYQRAAK